MKKFLSLMLCAALLLSCCPVIPLQASAATSGTCGDNLTWTLDEEGTLTISGTGAMNSYWDEDAPWYDNRDSIKTVIIQFGVTTIGSYSFYCSNLTSVTIPDSVTTIGEGAFYWCNLTTVTIPDSVTNIGKWAFAWCKKLTSVTIPDSVTTIGADAFSNCNSLTSITIPDSVTTIGDGAFGDCSSLIGIWIDTKNPKYSSDARGVIFNKNKTVLIQAPGGITGSYTVPDSVTTIGDFAFSYCTSLTSVKIPESVTTIGEYAFDSCNSLISVTIPDGVSTIGESAFCGCENLTSVSMGDSLTTIGNLAFAYCENLTIVTIQDGLTTIGDEAFDSCGELTDVYYTGTKAQWKEISIGYFNEDLTGATIHYNHVHNYWSETVEATCLVNGYVEYTCACGKTYREKLPRLPHNFAEGVCAVCGAPESVPGNLDGNETVDEDDVIYLLQHLLMPEDFPVNQSVDHDKNNTIDEDDVIYLLQHLLMPDEFPL